MVKGSARAYAFRFLRANPVVEETLEGVPVSVWFDPRSRSASAWDRRLAGRRLAFRAAGRGLFADRETGTLWNMDGEGVSGPFRGRRLTPLFGLMSEWHAWVAVHPAATLR